jgi:hypothetical protein
MSGSKKINFFLGIGGDNSYKNPTFSLKADYSKSTSNDPTDYIFSFPQIKEKYEEKKEKLGLLELRGRRGMHATLYRVRGQPQCMPNSISNRREKVMDTICRRIGKVPSL